MEQTVSMIKSCIVINKGGLLLKDLNSSYKELVGYSIPYKKFNHDSLESFVQSIPEIHTCDSSDGLVLTIKDPKLAHISDMVAKQKGVAKKNKPPCQLQQKIPVSYKIRPKLPASSLKVSNTGIHEVKCMIKSCIATNKGGLPLNALNRIYKELVGEPIHYRKYNYASLEELVYNIPEVVVTDGRDGQILTIRDPKLAHITDLVAKQKGQDMNKVRTKTAVSNSSVPYKGQSSSTNHTVQPHASTKKVQPDTNGDSSRILQEETNTISVMTSILVINNGKIYLNDLCCNYKDLIGEFIPYKKFNYKSLADFISSVPEFQISHDLCGQIVMLRDPKFSRSHQPVTKLKCEDNGRISHDACGKIVMLKGPKFSRSHQQLKYEGNEMKEAVESPPSGAVSNNEPSGLSAALLEKKEKYEIMSMIKACLKINNGGLLMEDLNFYYEDLVGEFIPYRRFGYETLVEFLCDVPEIFISERRGGYFVTLDEPATLQKNGGYAPRASLPISSHGEHLHDRSLLRNSFGPESDIRDLMCKNGVIKVTIKNDLYMKPSGQTAVQTNRYHICKNSGWTSGV